MKKILLLIVVMASVIYAINRPTKYEELAFKRQMIKERDELSEPFVNLILTIVNDMKQKELTETEW